MRRPKGRGGEESGAWEGGWEEGEKLTWEKAGIDMVTKCRARAVHGSEAGWRERGWHGRRLAYGMMVEMQQH